MSIPNILPRSPSFYPKGYYSDDIKKNPYNPTAIFTAEEQQQTFVRGVGLNHFEPVSLGYKSPDYPDNMSRSIIKQNPWEKIDFTRFCSIDVYLYYRNTLEENNVSSLFPKAKKGKVGNQLKLADHLYYSSNGLDMNAYDWYKAVADCGEPRAKYMVSKIDRQSKPDLDPEDVILFDLLDQMFLKFKTEPPRLTA